MDPRPTRPNSDGAALPARRPTRRQPRGDGPAATVRNRPPPPDHVHLHIRSTNSVVVVPPSEIRHRPSPPATAAGDDDSRTPDTPPISVPHCPGGAASTTAIVYAPRHLCEAYADRGLCPTGALCPDVHAVITPSMPRYYPHVRAYAGNEGTPRLGPAGEWHAVAAENARIATMRVEVSECLMTRVFARLRATVRCDPPSVCAHFVAKSVCNFGAQCRFVHPLSQPVPLGSHGIQPPVHGSALIPRIGPEAARGTATAGRRSVRFWHNPYGAAPGWSGGGGAS